MPPRLANEELIPVDWQAVAAAHDAMKQEYDQLLDLWYPHLFAKIHEFIARHLSPTDGQRAALDVGCGTGLQSFLLARAGYQVLAFDIADDLLDVARSKRRLHAQEPLVAPPLFDSQPGIRWIAAHHARLARRLEELRQDRSVEPPEFQHANLEDFDYGVDRWDVICCCGSVLSFVDGYANAITQMTKGLRRGGLLFIEVEQKRNMDLLWPIVDRLLGKRLHYDQSWSEVFRNLFSRPGMSVRIDYPFTLHNGGEVVLPLWLFSTRELHRLFANAELRVKARMGIHHLTNLIPSTVLHEQRRQPAVERLFNALRRLDSRLSGTWPFWRLGCSSVFCLQRVGTLT